MKRFGKLLQPLLMMHLFLPNYLNAKELNQHQKQKVFYLQEAIPWNKGDLETTIKEIKKYLSEKSSKMNLLKPTIQSLKFKNHKKSLIGTHYYFEQYLNSAPIKGAELIVSINENLNQVFKIYNNTVDPSLFKKAVSTAKAKISEKESLQIAWDYIKPQGKLLAVPQSQLNYIDQRDKLALVYEVRIPVEDPFGYWVVEVAAESGKVLSIYDERISRKDTIPFHKLPRNFDKPYTSLDQAIKSYREQLLKDATIKEGSFKGENKNGTGLVFDPDPRTVLSDSSLQHNSSSDLFEGAYKEKVLNDLNFVSDTYHLAGPWVQIKDFESPNIAPSTNRNGTWNQKRDSTDFHDVMTYYHLDKNQRYMQSLGFTGDKGIQELSIEVDANGLRGADNSHFIPSQNRIAFGHGCVPDNEDADVILHEYGHAIHYSINSNWGGGDSGAMGEGFGDYWAASYSISTAEGKSYKPNEVFSWDGHGNGDECWGGRNLDKLDARYDPDKHYGAHTRIPGGSYSDELWSTPLFQSLLKLLEKGYPRENVDKIILEAHFGLGSGMTMREMAKAIIRTARELYPDEDYAAVFAEKFAHHNIIDLPHADFEIASWTTGNTGDNQAPDPGETFDLAFSFKNIGTAEAQNVSAKISSKLPSVSFERDTVSLPDIAPGATAESTQTFIISLDQDLPCGTLIPFKVLLTFTGGATFEKELFLEVQTGIVDGSSASMHFDPVLNIPDNQSTGVSTWLEIDDAGTVGVDSLKVNLDLNHTYIGDLKLTLTAPNGQTVALHNKSGGSAQNIIGTYPTDLTPAESLDKLVGTDLRGKWTLTAVDSANRDTGYIKEWGISYIKGYQCEANQ